MRKINKYLTKEYWANQNRYIGLLCIVLVKTALVYLILHNCLKNVKGYEMVKLPTHVKQHINSLIESDSKDSVSDTTPRINISDTAVSKVIIYIQSKYHDWDPDNKSQVQFNLKGISSVGAISYLSNETIKVKSFFWLNGSWTLLEIFFWSIFGVIASLLYFITEAIRNKDPNLKFEANQIPSHIAKLFYAPLISYVIIFSYTYFQSDQSVDFNVSKALLVVSFLLGFYSGRAMEFLNRIKEVLLPYSATNLVNQTGTSNTENKKLSVTVNLPTEEIPEGSNLQSIQAQLKNTVVKLIDKETKKEIILKSVNDSTKIKFETSDFLLKTYGLDASLMTTEGIAFQYLGEINTNNLTEFTLNLKKFLPPT